MALINCIECQGKLSDLAESCPHCGAPVSLSNQSQSQLVKNCFECDAELEAGIEVCNSCGVDQSFSPNQEGITSDKPAQEELIEESTTKTEPENKINDMTQTKKKSKFFRNLSITIGIIVALGVVTFFVLPDDSKRELFHYLGIENSDFVKEMGLKSYVTVGGSVSRNTLFGKVAVTGTLFNTHSSATIRSVTLRFEFSDGNEDRSISVKIPPNNSLGRPFTEKFDSHKNATFRGVSVVSAYE